MMKIHANMHLSKGQDPTFCRAKACFWELMFYDELPFFGRRGIYLVKVTFFETPNTEIAVGPTWSLGPKLALTIYDQNVQKPTEWQTNLPTDKVACRVA